MINHDPILLENEQMLWKMGDDDKTFLAFPHLGKAPTRALTTTFMPSIFAIALGIETVMDMLTIVMMNNVDAIMMISDHSRSLLPEWSKSSQGSHCFEDWDIPRT